MADDKDSPLVELSVSGTSFIILRATLLQANWILSKAFDSDVPWGVYHNGKYFIDGDPISFRWILHFVRHNCLPEAILQSQTELSAIRTLADFLCYSDLVEFIDRDQTCSRVKELEAQLKKSLDDQITTLNDELCKFRAFADEINRMKCQSYKCGHPRCTTSILILSPQSLPEVTIDLESVNCDKHFGPRYTYRKGRTMWPWSEFPLFGQLHRVLSGRE